MKEPRHGSVLIPALLLLASCDEAKKFIDPSGKAYGQPVDSAPSPTTSMEPVPSEPPATVPPTPSASPISTVPSWTHRETEPLTASKVLEQARDMLMTSPRGWLEFSNGRATSQGRNLTLWDGSETPWGVGITDLNQDGAEDAVLAVRSTSSRDTNWLLAVLVDRGGKLQCIQSLSLEGSEGVRSLEATQGGLLLVPQSGAPRLFGWVGGELVGNN